MDLHRDETGRLQVGDETLRSNALGVVLAVCLSTEAIMRILRCDLRAAEAFQENAHADLLRIRSLVGRA